MTKGYYSIIQYCPNHLRLEVANVGILLFCPKLRFLEVSYVGNNERIQQFFSKDFVINRICINFAKEAVKERLKIIKEQIVTLDDLKQYIDSRANSIIITPPRSIMVDNPELELQELCKELVGFERRQ